MYSAVLSAGLVLVGFCSGLCRFDLSSHTADSVFQHFPPHRLQRAAANKEKGGDEYHRGATLELLEIVASICSKTHFEDERVLTGQQARQLEQVEALKSMDPNMTLRGARVQFPTLMGKMDPGLSLTSGRSKMFASLASLAMDDAQRKVVGDASETALFNFVRARQSIELLRFHHAKVYEVPFNSRNKYAITIVKPVALEHESANKRTMLMKGAPEVILARCTHYLNRGEKKPIDERFKSEFKEAYERFGNMGQRVLGFAMLDLPEDQFGADFDSQYQTKSELVPNTGLVFLGLISLVDPPKQGVAQAVTDCHTAGIKVIMVSESAKERIGEGTEKGKGTTPESEITYDSDP
jgi:magnesium-transporting ATPase (P-type)